MTVAKEIRQKIKSIDNTKKITKVMEMVAASKMRATQERMRKAIPYANIISKVIGYVARSHAEYQHPYMEIRATKRVGYIIISSDRGLCGGLNNNLFKATIKDIQQKMNASITIDLCLIGSKAAVFFRRVGGSVIAHKSHIGDAPTLFDIIGVVKAMLNKYLDKSIDALYLCSNQFISTMRQEPRIQQLLPLIPVQDDSMREYWDYIYEPDNAHLLLDTLLTRYIESQVYRGVLENIASEQAARMLAMRNATENAEDLLVSLRLTYNKARQAAITRELSEIVGGASVIT